MKISVAVCTWNRAKILRSCLEQMTQLEIPARVKWELLVINNNCTDETDKVIEGFHSRLPIRRLFEASPGLSRARNRALSEAKGDYILFTDDDVMVDKAWIATYAEAFESRPDCSVFGGPVHLCFLDTPPAWLKTVLDQVRSAYAFVDYGPEPFDLDQTKIPFGANFALHSADLHGLSFDPALGVRPDSRIGWEEIVFMRTLFRSGLKGLWVPKAQVRHLVGRERQTLGYLQRYYDAQGQYRALTCPDESSPMIFGRPRWAWRKAIELELRYRWIRLFAKPQVWIDCLVASSIARGYLRACHKSRSGGSDRD